MQTHKVIELITGEKWKAPPLEKGKIITLKFPGKCRQCKTRLRPGDIAKWYGKGRLYGLHCHSYADSSDPNVTVIQAHECFDAAM